MGGGGRGASRQKRKNIDAIKWKCDEIEVQKIEDAIDVHPSRGAKILMPQNGSVMK